MTERCLHCDEPIDGEYEVIPYIDADGVASPRQWHRECVMRSIVGGLNHLRGECTCCGGTEPPDPPNLTRREAAIAACAAYIRQRNGRPR